VPISVVLRLFFCGLVVADLVAEELRVGCSANGDLPGGFAAAGLVAAGLVDGGLPGLRADVGAVGGLASAGLVPEARALAVFAAGGAFRGATFRAAATLAPRRVILTGLPDSSSTSYMA
jgi:hypothetical protein